MQYLLSFQLSVRATALSALPLLSVSVAMFCTSVNNYCINFLL